MLEWLWATRADFQHIYAVLLFFAVLRWGAAPERILTSTFLGMEITDFIYHRLVGGSIFWLRLDVGHVVLDVLLFAVFIPVALRANRAYPLWVGGAQIISIASHVYRFWIVNIDRFGYDVMAIVPSYIQLVALTLGLIYHARRHKRLGDYPSWRSELLRRPTANMVPLQAG